MTKKTVTLLLLFLAVLTASAEDEKRNMFNPIHTALVSQTLRLTHVVEVLVMSERQPTRMWPHSIGTRRNIRSASQGQEFP